MCCCKMRDPSKVYFRYCLINSCWDTAVIELFIQGQFQAHKQDFSDTRLQFLYK